MKIAIVGAEESKWSGKQKEDAYHILTALISYWNRGHIFISGRCPKGGIDIWGEFIANNYNMKTEIYPPEQNSKEYYFKRNRQIAEAADILYCLSPKGVWNGGLWTADYAEKLGKIVVRIEIV